MSPHSSVPLQPLDKRRLLEIARRAIIEAIVHQRIWHPAEGAGALAERRGIFVTLRRRGKLRGCIGRVESPEPLALGAAESAVAAAVKDTRFHPLGAPEISDLLIEISVLTEFERIQPHEIVIGTHGLMVSHGPHRGLLLPQVALEHRWTTEQFLRETCEKGGLPPHAWQSPEACIDGFAAEHFSEAEFGAGAIANAAKENA